MALGTELAAPAAISLAGVGKTYLVQGDRKVVLRDIDLEVASGEFLVLLGPSGSGKTTLMRIIGGLVEATAGRVVLDGVPRKPESGAAPGLGFVFQDANLAFLKGLLAAMEFTMDKSNWAAAAAAVQAYSPGTTTASVTQQLPIIIADWQANGADKLLEFDTAAWTKAQSIFKQIGLISKTLPITDIIDTSLVTAAKS